MPGEDQIFQKIPFVPPPTPEQESAARKVVCGFSDDAKDAETLLMMLGLL